MSSLLDMLEEKLKNTYLKNLIKNIFEINISVITSCRNCSDTISEQNLRHLMIQVDHFSNLDQALSEYIK